MKKPAGTPKAAPGKVVHRKPVTAKVRLARHLAAVKAARTRARHKHVAKAKAHRKVTLARPGGISAGIKSPWILGGNDDLGTCGAVAVANHLLAVTGIRASDEDVLRLHRLASGSGGAPIAIVLEAAAEALGIPLRFDELDPAETCDGPRRLILGLDFGAVSHAVLDTGTEWITWGTALPATAFPDVIITEAWLLDWEAG